jgi:RecA-family ATPase
MREDQPDGPQTAYAEARQQRRNKFQNEAIPPDLILTLAEWLTRELPDPDCLLGSWLTTTSRVLINAPTGIGKTMWAIGLALAGGHGKGFLHWAGTRPVKVLVIDGEMSRRLMKMRLQQEAHRAGVEPVNVYILSREDLDDLQPLNTPRGQMQIDQVIAHIGGVDLVILDNIMSLTSGEMKEELSWAQTIPWVRALTKRAIGQIWIHHTGHDETKGYGTKTREWEMDTVAMLERVERADTDVSFMMNFTKARERRPDNRDEFTAVNVALVDDQWTYSRTEQVHKGKASPMAQKFLEALEQAVRDHTSLLTGLNATKWVKLDDWKAICIKRGLIDGNAKPDSARSLFSRYRRELIAANLIVTNETEAMIL